MSQKYLTGIIVCGERKNGRGEIVNPVFMKYRNIQDIFSRRNAFLKFAATQKGAQYVNFYDKETENFVQRAYLQEYKV